MNNSEAYRHFASLYDELMAEAPYNNWLEFLKRKTAQYEVKDKRLLDVGCGTGTLAVMLANDGYEVTGVDLSEEMLTIASIKAAESPLSVVLVQQDMRELDLGETFPLITAFCDCINYLETYDDVERTFTAVYEHLESGGLFLFDVHSIYKMDHVFQGASFSFAGEELSYIWDCFEGPYEHSVDHELSFFVLEETGLYRRYDEVHHQRTFEKDVYVNALEKAGFHVLDIEGDFKDGMPDQHAERLFFTAVKQI
ncbi:MAG: class I SAM-dependent DNA methyltransferase [Tuberibacillus sp.]